MRFFASFLDLNVYNDMVVLLRFMCIVYNLNNFSFS